MDPSSNSQSYTTDPSSNSQSYTTAYNTTAYNTAANFSANS